MSDCFCPTHHVIDRDGYPRAKHQSRLWRLNRLVWTLVRGPIAAGLVVAHTCNNKGCLNPEHFYLTTQEQNSSDAARDGLYSGRFKYTANEYLEMWGLYHNDGYSQQAIADRFGMSQSGVSSCIRRATKLMEAAEMKKNINE